MKVSTKHRIASTFYATAAVLAGAAVIHFGDRLLGVNLELFYGIATFNPMWIIALFVVPFVGGMVVSFVFGLGGKMLAYFPALIVRGTSYVEVSNAPILPDGMSVLPIGYWLLVVVVAVEFAGLGGIVGEALIKKTYGRSAKHKVHKKYQKERKARTVTPDQS